MFEPIDIGEFERRTGIKTRRLAVDVGKFSRLVSLREITNVACLVVMPRDYLYRLLTSTVLLNSKDLVYEGCTFEVSKMDPNSLLVGQTFVERPKYSRIVESLASVFNTSCLPRGYAKLTAHIIFGYTVEGEAVMAHYVPPIVEVNSHHSLLDGLHRNYLGIGVGTSIVSIVVKNIKAPFPCDAGPWSEVKVVDVKPPPGERYHNLKPALFRDLKWVGIDG